MKLHGYSIMILVAGCLAVQAPDPARASRIIEDIVAKVDRHIITRTELEEASKPSIEQIRQSVSPSDWDQRIRDVRNRILNQMINEYVVLRFARDNEMTVSEAEMEGILLDLRQNAGIESEEEFIRQLAEEGIALDELKEILEKQTLVRRILRSEVYSKIRITEAEIKQHYMDNRDLYKTVEKVRPAILMVSSGSGNLFSKTAAEQKIHELHEKLENGADFAELVALHSDGPARDSGGDIGFLEKGKIQPVIEKAAFEMDAGDVSRPIETENGWMIVKVLEKDQAGFESLEAIRSDIERQIHEQKALYAEQEWFDRQRSRTYIEIFDF
jgi:parvulin-like peptidyl-prolyl isomerase